MGAYGSQFVFRKEIEGESLIGCVTYITLNYDTPCVM